MKRQKHRHIAAAACLMSLLGLMGACANIGKPEGGPRDYTPPAVVGTSPAPGTVNFKGDKVVITFDEIVQLKDQTKKVIISPAPPEQPVIKVLGKKIIVGFRDKLLDNTTYVIDFTNAISDNNEDNVLDGYAFAFSTGETIDTLQASGIVLQARDLEPMQHVLVGLHSNLADSAFTTLPFDRITRTNDRGEFTLRNLQPGTYRAYALNDLDGNYKMTRNEDYAWTRTLVVPTVGAFESQDTVFTFDQRIDTITTGLHTEFLPNDVYLPMFNEGYSASYLKKTERPADNRLVVTIAAPQPRLPQLRVLSPRPAERHWAVNEYRATRDSLVCWLTDSTLILSDSITVALTYFKSDSLDNLQPVTDTVHFVNRKSNAQLKQREKEQKARAERDKAIAKLEERLERLAAQGKDTQEVEDELETLRKANAPVVAVLALQVPQGQMGVTDSLFIATDTPIAGIDPAGCHLEMMNPDSTWTAVPLPRFVPSDTCSQLRYVVPMRLTPGGTYRFIVDSLAVQNIYGVGNNPVKNDLKVRNTEEYASLFLTLQHATTPAFVELLDASEKVAARASVASDGNAEFHNVEPGTYYARVVLDTNGNGRWDPGHYATDAQPEEVLYYPAKMRLRANWDVEQAWDIFATALNLQKPDDIKRNKPEGGKSLLEQKLAKDKSKKKAEEEEEDEFNSNAFSRGLYTGDKYRDTRQR